MSLNEEQLQTVQSLVKEKRYAEATAFLKTLGDDPQAKQWLAVLANVPPEREGKREFRKNEWRPHRYIIAGVLIFGFYFFTRDAVPAILRALFGQ